MRQCTAQLCLSSHYVNMNSERNYMAKAEEGKTPAPIARMP